MFKLWHKLAQDARFMAILVVVIVMQFSYNVMLFVGWNNAPSQIDVHHIPGLQSVVTTKLHETPKATIYGFAFYIWQAINNWPTDGKREFTKNIYSTRYYITPRFRQDMERQIETLLREGEIQGRTRMIRAEYGQAFTDTDVTVIEPGKIWEVRLEVRLTETSNGIDVKDIIMEYPLRVVHFDVNREYNYWGLAIDGFTRKPLRIKTLL